jgi:hypothetical protein
MDQRVRDELVEFTERVAAEDRAIAQAQARRIERLLELQDWAENPRVSSRLHGDRDSIRAADRDAATLTADQARAAAFARWDEHQIARRTIVTETACLTRTAERTIDHQLEEARFLTSCAPATFDALAAGDISYRHATTLLDQLRTVPDEQQAAFEEKVLPVAKSLPVGRFRDKARRLRERLHPETIVIRTKNALADRRTYWEPAHDGMAWLHWCGTAEQTKAACERITGMAASLRKLGDPSGTDTDTELPPRTLDQLRADVTAGLLLDGVTPTGLGAGIRGSVMVTRVGADPARTGRGTRHPGRVRADLTRRRPANCGERAEFHPDPHPPGDRGDALGRERAVQSDPGHAKGIAGSGRNLPVPRLLEARGEERYRPHPGLAVRRSHRL